MSFNLNCARRRWLQVVGGAALAAATPMAPISFGRWQDEQKRLRWLTSDPRNGEPVLSELVKTWITPVEHFYVRSHALNPVIDSKRFRIRVEGKVRQPMDFSLDQLAQLKRISTTATMTCAGNRRTEFNQEKKVGGVQWGAGAIGNAKWQGIALADVLKWVEVLDEAKHVWFEGLDQIQRQNGVIPFGASIPIEKAMIAEGPGRVLLCDKMNGESLTADHGFPLRTVVPGYIGARSVKWLGKIVVSDRPSPNHYVSNAYKIVRDQTALEWKEAGPIYRFPINAALCSPLNGSRLKPGTIKISGYALPTGLSGNKIQSVAVSTDNGKRWKTAATQNNGTDFCWSLWSLDVKIDESVTNILVKAHDSSGAFMPQRVPWNAKGYLQNSWFHSKVNVSG